MARGRPSTFSIVAADPATGEVGHLRQAIELDGSLKDLARGDGDFAPLKEDPEFQALLS